MALGIFGSVANVLGLWAVVRLLGALGEGQAPSRLGPTLTVLAFVLKLPLILAMMYLAHRLGGPALAAFLIGLGMVYSALIGWALATS